MLGDITKDNAQAQVHTGAMPPQKANVRDYWVDKFGDLHVYEGNFWVKMNAAQPESAIIGTFEGVNVWFGNIKPFHEMECYWVQQDYSMDGYHVTYIKGEPFKDQEVKGITKVMILQLVGKTVANPPPANFQKLCLPEEAEEKLQAFEDAADISGRLAVMERGADVLKKLNIVDIESETLDQYITWLKSTKAIQNGSKMDNMTPEEKKKLLVLLLKEHSKSATPEPKDARDLPF